MNCLVSFIKLFPHRGSFVTVKKISEEKCSKRCCMAIYAVYCFLKGVSAILAFLKNFLKLAG